MWGSMGGGGVSEGEEGGGGRCPPPPPQTPPKRSPSPPQNPPPTNESFLSSRPTKATMGRSPGLKGPTPPPPPPSPPPPPHGLRRSFPPPNPPISPRPPPQPLPPPTKTNTPKGAEKKDDRPGDPIIGTVVQELYPKGVERGTVRAIHGRKNGAVWVEYLGGTTLYEVSRSLLFPTPEEAERHREEAQAAGRKNAKPPTPANEASNPPNANPTTEPTNSTTPLTLLNPHPDLQRCGTPLRDPTRYEGPDRDPRGHNGHGQET